MRDDSSRGRRGRGAAGSRLSTAALAVGACIFAVLMVIRPAGAHEAASSPASGTPIYLDRSYTYQERAADLVARLTPTPRGSELVSSQAPEISKRGNPLVSPAE